MATTCQSCSAVSQLWLCGRCQGDLRQMLDGLALGTPLTIKDVPVGGRAESWLEALEDSRYGKTRLGESSRQSTERNSPLVVRIGPGENPPKETQWEGSPLALLREFHGVLSTWIRHITESRGTVFAPVRSVPAWFVGPLREDWRRLAHGYRATITDCAEWLAFHVPAIARDEACGELFRDVKGMVERIEKVVNRPVPPKCCGPCPAKVADKHGQEQDCATSLYVPWDHHGKQYATDVECWKCHNTHNVDALIQQALDSVAGLLYSAKEVHALMAQIGRPIPSRTWRYWRAEDKIIIRGWRGVEPMYWINDVQELLDQKPQKATTGAAAKKAV